ncbi:MAG: PhoX family phosphatase [Alphaproteobacteria bacterium]|nr:PhoX family phosphatase [Alphaproteobacteria bacterium]
MTLKDDESTPAIARGAAAPLADLIELRMSRRDALKAGAAAGAFGLFGAGLGGCASTGSGSIGFQEIKHAMTSEHQVAPGYDVQVVIRWGDPLFPDAAAFDPRAQTAATQRRQFGYDNDFLAFMPLPVGSSNSERGVLCANHERCSAPLMWPGADEKTWEKLSREQCEVEMACQGHDFVEIKQERGRWQVVTDSPYNRRFTPLETPFRVGGPAAGHTRMRTHADPAGTRVIGTMNNCAGGKTPWGTVLSGEENIHNYFLGNPDQGPEASARKRYGISGKPRYVWGRYFDRFNLDKEPNEANRFGWIVEMDPYDPTSTPVKRTALGRFKHEGATCAVSHDGRVAVYSGDDERMEYVYKFVTKGRFDPANRAANRDLLDEGTLYVARFESDGSLRWLPLVHGEGPLGAANGFQSQADVLIEARRAADLLGGTPMDRPEDIEPDPRTGRVYVVMTYNERRTPQQVNAANPRARNRFGHIVEIIPPTADGKADHGATSCRWDFLLLAGDPAKPDHGARYGAGTARGSSESWLSCPDNLAFDPRGRLWITTDGQDDAVGFCDSAYAAETSGPERGVPRLFFNAPRGAEICGPEFTPDGRTLFLAIQHPAEEKDSTFDKPSTRWPDFRADMPPRPSVVAISRKGGGEVGS